MSGTDKTFCTLILFFVIMSSCGPRLQAQSCQLIEIDGWILVSRGTIQDSHQNNQIVVNIGQFGITLRSEDLEIFKILQAKNPGKRHWVMAKYGDIEQKGEVYIIGYLTEVAKQSASAWSNYDQVFQLAVGPKTNMVLTEDSCATVALQKFSNSRVTLVFTTKVPTT